MNGYIKKKKKRNYIVIWVKRISPASHSSRYTETKLWILLHFNTDLKYNHILSLAVYAYLVKYLFLGLYFVKGCFPVFIL